MGFGRDKALEEYFLSTQRTLTQREELAKWFDELDEIVKHLEGQFAHGGAPC